MQAILAIVLIILACLFYTLSLIIGWKRICFGSTLSLGIAIFPDMYGTKLMYDISGSFNWSFHATVGLIALISMIVLTIISGFQWEKKRNPRWFRITYRITYVAWIASFIAGIIEHAV